MWCVAAGAHRLTAGARPPLRAADRAGVVDASVDASVDA
jgi:hypothetical protein